MLKTSEIIGYSVFCKDSNYKEGEVKDIILNFKDFKIESLIVEHNNFFHTTKILDFNNIYSIENETINIKFNKNLKPYKRKKNKKNTYTSMGLEVINEKGEILGFIKDIVFKKNDGNILGIILTNGVIDDILTGIQIIPIDNELIIKNEKMIVPDKLSNSLVKNIGGLKKLLELDR